MIDLHLHTTASDGYLSPAQLVARAKAAGLTTISITDHDTVAAIAEVTDLAHAAGVRVIPGIEITAVDDGRDVHMLGYFFDPGSGTLATLLERQRALRVARVREIGERLAVLNMPVDVESVLLAAAARPGSSVGRPLIARELMRAGYVASVQQAFDLWLATGRPAFVPRTGPSPASVVGAIHEAGGIASMAHPGVTKRDDLIGPLVDNGMDAIEVYHSDHTPEAEQTYKTIAKRHGLPVSGGSDFHGDELRRNTLGVVLLPQPDFDALVQAHDRRSS
ncbi:MAG TPA: PHP domain-containing protein [Vicinamibacterales bacterium]|nr:PHP domain-containing protein [Vicinamibacterales bacterium]